MFDFSDYPRDSKFFDPANKNVIGKMKGELKRKIISEFVGLKSKMYSLVDMDVEESKIAKGVNRGVVRGGSHKEFVNVLLGGKLIKHKMNRIQSKLHRIATFDVFKISLSCFDDKRCIKMMALIVWLIFIKV